MHKILRLIEYKDKADKKIKKDKKDFEIVGYRIINTEENKRFQYDMRINDKINEAMSEYMYLLRYTRPVEMKTKGQILASKDDENRAYHIIDMTDNTKGFLEKLKLCVKDYEIKKQKDKSKTKVIVKGPAENKVDIELFGISSEDKKKVLIKRQIKEKRMQLKNLKKTINEIVKNYESEKIIKYDEELIRFYDLRYRYKTSDGQYFQSNLVGVRFSNIKTNEMWDVNLEAIKKFKHIFKITSYTRSRITFRKVDRGIRSLYERKLSKDVEDISDNLDKVKGLLIKAIEDYPKVKELVKIERVLKKQKRDEFIERYSKKKRELDALKCEIEELEREI